MKPDRELGVLAGLLALYGATRAAILVGWNQRIDTEEMSFGALPAHLSDGLMLDLLAYQTQWREGGSVLMAPVVGAVMAVLGDSFLAIKAGGLVWYGLMLLTWWLLARLAFGATSALILAALLALAPPFFTTMQFTMLAAHGEAQLLPALALICGLVAIRRDDPRWLLGAGLFAGLGWSFAYSAGPLGLLALGWLAIAGPGPLRQRIGLLQLGGILGLAPWLLYFIVEVDLASGPYAGRQGFLATILGTGEGSGFFSDSTIATDAAQLVQHHLWAMWGWADENGHYRSGFNVAFGASVLSLAAGAVVAAIRGREPIGVLLGLSVPLYCGVAVLTGARLSSEVYDGYRYLLPVQLALLALAAAALGAAWEHSRPTRRIAALALALLVGSTGLEMARASTIGQATPLWGLRGHTLQVLETELQADQITRRTLLRERADPTLELSTLEGVATAHPEWPTRSPCPAGATCFAVREGTGHLLASELFRDGIDADHIATWLALEPTHRADLLRGLGRGLPFYGPVPAVWERAQRDLLDHLPPADRTLVLEGVGIQDVLGNNFHFGRATGGGPEPEAWARGVGRALARLVLDREAPPALDDLPQSIDRLIDPAWATAIRAGYRAELERLPRSP